MTDKRFTPASTKVNFVIPLYQRLFEWEKEQVEQLLNDLYSSFKKHPDEPYYIGVLTVFRDNNSYALVDGQQRFTVLTLIGIELGWSDFLKENNEYRLTFFARKKDQEDLKAKIDGMENYIFSNKKMEVALETIGEFFKQKVNNEQFKEFVYRNTTFFLSELPQNYKVQELNQYFEAMNEAGKGLENHEILKVLVLKELPEDRIDECTKIWNLVSEMDKCLIIQKYDENKDNYSQRILEEIVAIKSGNFQKVLISNDVDNKNIHNIVDIIASPNKPQDIVRDKSEKSILTFSEFLLQILWLTIDNKNIPLTDFFNKHKLLETFENYLLKDENRKILLITFFNNLIKYRLLFDYFIIRINSADGKTHNYSLNFYAENEDESKSQLIQYQSMLYVSTSTYHWLSFILKKLDENYNITYKSLTDSFKDWDNDRHKNKELTLLYGSIDRYWFWRLDYYLWEKRKDYFVSTESKSVADNYLFKTNRSIEHIAPQKPKSESLVSFNTNELIHEFGNLSMISSGQNSSLKNESYDLKRAHVQSFINKSVGGSIESLKLLKAHEFDIWCEESIIKHHNNMIDILIASFNGDGSFLESLKITNHAI